MRSHSIFSIFRRWRHSLSDQRASNVAQATAVAMVAAAMIGALVLFAPTLGSAVDTQFSCLQGVLSGSGAGCASGDGAASEPAPAENSDGDDGGDDGGGWSWGGILDGVQVVLDVAGLVPGLGEIADGANALISLARGDYVGAALSAGAMIPFAGWGATGAKWVRTGIEYSDEIAGATRHADEAAGLSDEAAAGTRNADDMDPICTSSAPRGKAPGLAKPAAQGCDLPGSSAHREQRWQEYLERKRAEGEEPWSREHWDKVYTENVNRARKAHERVNAYHQELGWGQREVTVELPDGSRRRLDIADTATQRGIEHKTGYTTRGPEIDSEVARDAELVRQDWDIKWVFEGRPSQPLIELLEKHGIRYEILTPP